MVWKSPVIPWDLCDNERKDRLRYVWKHGELSYKLDPVQLEVYRDIKEKLGKVQHAAERTYALDWSRQNGKDRLMLTLAFETMAKNPNRRIPYGAPTQNMVIEILEPIVDDMLIDCPPELKPEHRLSDHQYIHPNGCKLVLVGCDIHPDRLRGPGAVAIFLTEAAFMGQLDPEILSAIDGQMIVYPDAFKVMGSTPPVTIAHPWTKKIISTAKLRGLYDHRTIYDNPRITKDTADAFCREAGSEQDPVTGEWTHSTRTLREFFARHVVEEELMVIPEWVEAKNECVVDTYVRPSYAHGYVSLDPGVVHLCGLLFGYYHFERDMLVIEKAWAQRNANTSTVAAEIEKTEKEIWSDQSLQFAEDGIIRNNPYKRVSDTDRRMILDLATEHNLDFDATAKDNLIAAVNGLRIRVQNCKIRILPGANELVTQLDSAVWNKQKTKFDILSPELGHFDLVAALIYMHRNLDTHLNPMPKDVYHESVVFHNFHKQRQPGSGWIVQRDRKGRVVA